MDAEIPGLERLHFNGLEIQKYSDNARAVRKCSSIVLKPDGSMFGVITKTVKGQLASLEKSLG